MSRRLWPLVTAALLGLPVLYVASFGPACWLAWRLPVPRRPMAAIYRPILFATSSGPAPVRTFLRRYAQWNSPPNPVHFMVDDWDTLTEAQVEELREMVYGILEELEDAR